MIAHSSTLALCASNALWEEVSKQCYNFTYLILYKHKCLKVDFPFYLKSWYIEIFASKRLGRRSRLVEKRPFITLTSREENLTILACYLLIRVEKFRFLLWVPVKDNVVQKQSKTRHNIYCSLIQRTRYEGKTMRFVCIHGWQKTRIYNAVRMRKCCNGTLFTP